MSDAKNEPKNDPFKLTDEEIIHGVPVALATREGKPLTVRVLECPLPKFQDYFQAVAFKDLAKELDLTTDQAVETLGELPNKRLIELQNLSRKVNADFFAKAVEELTPAAETKLEEMIAGLQKLENALESEVGRLGSESFTTNSGAPDSPRPKSTPLASGG